MVEGSNGGNDSSDKVDINISSSAPLIVAVMILGAIFLLGGIPFYDVPAGHCGAEYSMLSGVKNTSYGEGTHLKKPFIERSAVFDTRVQKYSRETKAASNDLQDVFTKITVNYHLNKNECHDMYQEVGKDYEDKVIDPTIKEVTKSVTAKYDATAMVQNRSLVKEDVNKKLEERLGRNYVYLDEVSIENIRFTDEFKDAIEQKEVAKQNAQEARNRLEEVRAKADQRIAEAEGEAQAIQEVTEQLKQSDAYIRYQMIEKWDGETSTIVPYVQSGEGSGATPLVQLPQTQKQNIEGTNSTTQ